MKYEVSCMHTVVVYSHCPCPLSKVTNVPGNHHQFITVYNNQTLVSTAPIFFSYLLWWMDEVTTYSPISNWIHFFQKPANGLNNPSIHRTTTVSYYTLCSVVFSIGPVSFLCNRIDRSVIYSIAYEPYWLSDCLVMCLIHLLLWSS